MICVCLCMWGVQVCHVQKNPAFLTKFLNKLFITCFKLIRKLGTQQNVCHSFIHLCTPWTVKVTEALIHLGTYLGQHPKGHSHSSLVTTHKRYFPHSPLMGESLPNFLFMSSAFNVALPAKMDRITHH